MFVFGEVFVAKRDEEDIICLYTNNTQDFKQDGIYLILLLQTFLEAQYL